MSKWPYSDVVHGNSDRSNGGGRTATDNAKADAGSGEDAWRFLDQAPVTKQFTPQSKNSIPPFIKKS